MGKERRAKLPEDKERRDRDIEGAELNNLKTETGVKGIEGAELNDLKTKHGVTLAAYTAANPGIYDTLKTMNNKNGVTMREHMGAYNKLRDLKTLGDNLGTHEELKDPKNPGVYDELKDQKTKSCVIVTDYTVANPGVFNKKENLVLK